MKTRFNIEFLLEKDPISKHYDTDEYKIVRSAYDDEGTNVFILLDKQNQQIISYSITGISERDKFGKLINEPRQMETVLKENYKRFFGNFTYLDGYGRKILNEEIQFVTPFTFKQQGSQDPLFQEIFQFVKSKYKNAEVIDDKYKGPRIDVGMVGIDPKFRKELDTKFPGKKITYGSYDSGRLIVGQFHV